MFKLLAKASQGTPRLINILCHKALISSYGKGKSNVGRKEMFLAILDTESISWRLKYFPINITKFLILIAVLIFGIELFLLLRL